MRRRPTFFVLLLLTLALTGSCARKPPANVRRPSSVLASQTLTGRVVRIADGDTITLLDAANTQHRIRLQGIDAPESRQAFGVQSKQNLSILIFDKNVTATCDKTDQYGRLVCKIVVDGKDINLEQVKAGMAWHYKEYENEQSPEDRELYGRAEDEARNARRGLWADANPIEPGEFRREEQREREGR
ncbi:MAG TPA: thermonuclease family protein [Pyrinomonadaceae bacterium]|jgi:endonuclease YncB( thermonuclease family)|nr:thermonuclease family protein [Pyrinomonadaceae bacterium]